MLHNVQTAPAVPVLETPLPRTEERRRRILFIGEGVTLAHVVRPLQMASQLDPERFEVLFACDPRYRRLVDETGLAYAPLPSIDSAVFIRRVYKAQPLYTQAELAREVEDDRALIARWQPDVVVGDFRISLGISAERSGTPHIAFSNAHWSPAAQLECPIPDHPLVGLLGLSLSKRLLPLTLPYFFRRQALAFNHVRKTYGLPPVGGRGAHEVFTRGTRTVYLDIPQLYGISELSASESYIGPVHWEPKAELPYAWREACTHGPVVFAYPGSSGNAAATLHLVRTAADLGATVLLAGVKRAQRQGLPMNILAVDVIPASAAARLADLVICNGGSPMVYHALSAGTPVLGMPVNLDQHFVMDAVQRHGAGRMMRPSRCRSKDAAATLRAMLGDASLRESALVLKSYIDAFDSHDEFLAVVEDLVPTTATNTEKHHAA